MKRVLLIFALFLFTSSFLVSCTDEYKNDDTETSSDKDEEPDPGIGGD